MFVLMSLRGAVVKRLHRLGFGAESRQKGREFEPGLRYSTTEKILLSPAVNGYRGSCCFCVVVLRPQ